jgi:hypothetical protein
MVERIFNVVFANFAMNSEELWQPLGATRPSSNQSLLKRPDS